MQPWSILTQQTVTRHSRLKLAPSSIYTSQVRSLYPPNSGQLSFDIPLLQATDSDFSIRLQHWLLCTTIWRKARLQCLLPNSWNDQWSDNFSPRLFVVLWREHPEKTRNAEDPRGPLMDGHGLRRWVEPAAGTMIRFKLLAHVEVQEEIGLFS